jgi:MoaA/NifB/PqqE/SkfB family radical SAM enzyme
VSDHWELDVLELVNKLVGAVPYHIYGGAYSEPLMNPYLMTFLATTKRYDNHFGIHTNGTLLNTLEENQGWLTELKRLATDDVDYLSISLDAGGREAWSKSKRSPAKNFDRIMQGLRIASQDRKYALRVCFLISPITGNKEDFKNIIEIAKHLKVDSLRFSVPYAIYNQDFSVLKKYKENVEIPQSDIYFKMLEPYLSKKQEKPYIFYVDPETTSYDQFYFDKCIYSYFQITFGADGYVYRCSSVAAPDAKHCRLGKSSSDLNEFRRMVMRNYNENWDCQRMCFDKGIRCNRMGIAINQEYHNVVC